MIVFFCFFIENI